MRVPDTRTAQMIKSTPPEVWGWLGGELAAQDKKNRTLRGDEAAEGRGRSQVLAEILKEADRAADAPPVCL